MSQYARVVEKLNEQGAQDFDRVPCLWCKTPSLRATLNHYGARCFDCYEASCSESQPMPRWMADKRAQGPKAWAHALKARDDAGERLTVTQRAMYRAALPSSQTDAPTEVASRGTRAEPVGKKEGLVPEHLLPQAMRPGVTEAERMADEA